MSSGGDRTSVAVPFAPVLEGEVVSVSTGPLSLTFAWESGSAVVAVVVVVVEEDGSSAIALRGGGGDHLIWRGASTLYARLPRLTR